MNGNRRSSEEKQRIVKQVEDFVQEGYTVAEASKRIGIHFATYYDWKRQLNGPRRVDRPRAAVSLQFKIVDASEAKNWISCYDSGRFAELRQNLMTQLAGLRKSEALQIPAPEDRKEVVSLLTACKRAIKDSRMDWKIRYSKSRKCIVAIHASRFVTNGKVD